MPWGCEPLPSNSGLFWRLSAITGIPRNGFASHDVFQRTNISPTVPSTFEWMGEALTSAPLKRWDYEFSQFSRVPKQRSACLRMQRTYPEARNFTWQFAFLLVKVDGDRHSQVWWRFGRGYEKPKHGSCDIYFPGGTCAYIYVYSIQYIHIISTYIHVFF